MPFTKATGPEFIYKYSGPYIPIPAKLKFYLERRICIQKKRIFVPKWKMMRPILEACFAQA